MSNGIDIDDWHDVVLRIRVVCEKFESGFDSGGFILLGALLNKINAMDARLRESEELRQAEVDRANGAVINDVLATIGSEGSE